MHTENPKNKASRIFDNLLIATFIIGLFLPLVLTHNRKESATEKRKLAEFPELKWDQKSMTKFPSQFESFFNDHFGLRDQLTHIPLVMEGGKELRNRCREQIVTLADGRKET
jgi:hypothetical protein